MDVSDPIFILRHLFIGDLNLTCLKTGDANDDSTVDMTDSMVLLSFLFLGSTPPPEPFGTCGLDPTADELSCDSYPPCP